MKFPVFTFARRVLRNFRRNQGLLLAGAVAYYTLLSLVPLFTLILVGLAHLFERDRLIAILSKNLEFLLPGHANDITEQVTGFFEHRQVVGLVGVLSLLFFSAMAFAVLESAMAAIFHHREPKGRHPLMSAVLPYIFVTALGFGMLLVTLVSGGLEAVGRASLFLFGRSISLAGLSRTLLYLVGVASSIVMLTALYAVMPVGHVAWRRALAGAMAATALWELARKVTSWYFDQVSMVNVLYGSLATTVIVLLTLEVGAIILLLGAQVIAELERDAAEKAAKEPGRT